MTNQLKSDHYIYFLYDKHDVVRYVGHGRCDRWKEASKKRSAEYNAILQNGGKVEIVKDNLTKLEAVAAENEYLTKYVNNTGDNFNLINRASTSSLTTLTYEFVSSVFKLDYNSLTFLVWLEDAPYGSGCFGRRAGHPVGSVANKARYGQAEYNGKHYLAHRLIWVLYNKQDLEHNFVINHVDSNTKNNHPTNLEKISQRDNILKRNIQPTDTGVIGVTLHKDSRKDYSDYRATVADSDNNRVTRSFSITKYGSEEALRLAKEWREAVAEYLIVQNKCVEDLPKEYRSDWAKKQKTNIPIGVSLLSKRGKEVFRGTFVLNGKASSKTFSVSKYGYDEAFRLACEWRKQMEELHYNK